MLIRYLTIYWYRFWQSAACRLCLTQIVLRDDNQLCCHYADSGTVSDIWVHIRFVFFVTVWSVMIGARFSIFGSLSHVVILSGFVPFVRVDCSRAKRSEVRNLKCNGSDASGMSTSNLDSYVEEIVASYHGQIYESTVRRIYSYLPSKCLFGSPMLRALWANST